MLFRSEEPARKIFKELISPVEKTIFSCSSILLDMYESRYVADSKQTSEDIIKLVNNAIENINSRGNVEQKNKLTKQLDKLKHHTISFQELINNPVEGVVFSYNNHTYKITSTFGPVNQIIGMNKFELDALNESKLLEIEDNGVMYAGAFDNPRKNKVEHSEANGEIGRAHV